MEHLWPTHIRSNPIVLELTTRSKIKPEGVLDDVIVSIDSWEYSRYFIILQPKNIIGGNPFIFRWPWLATTDTYIGFHSSHMYISHGDARNKVTLYPPTKSIQELHDTPWLDYDSSDEENNLDTMPNFDTLHQILSLDFQENFDSKPSSSHTVASSSYTLEPETTLIEISPGKSLHISSNLDSSQKE